MHWEDFIWEKYPRKINLYHFKKLTTENKLNIMNIIINNSDNKFVSLNINDNDITLFLDSELCSFMNTKMYYDENYIGYRLINTGTFMDESGLVNLISSKLNEHKIPILYITTCNSNYLFVPEEHEEQTDKILKIDII